MLQDFVDSRGVLLRRDVIAAGLDDRKITQAVKGDQLVRIHWGTACVHDVWANANRRERARIRSHAVRRLYGDDVARSHQSAVLEHGGPDWGLDLRDVHLTSLFGIGERTQAGIAHHRGTILVDDVTRHDGSWLTTPARSAMEAAMFAARDPAVAVLDWVQASGLASREELERYLARMKDWPGTIGLLHKLRLSNGRAESVLETRGHLLCRDHDVPMFEPQFEIFHPSGRLAGRADGAWPELKALLELDGREKYLRHRRPGETLEAYLMRERDRELTLRRLTGWFVVRLTWADIERPAKTAAYLLRTLATAARSGPAAEPGR